MDAGRLYDVPRVDLLATELLNGGGGLVAGALVEGDALVEQVHTLRDLTIVGHRVHRLLVDVDLDGGGGGACRPHIGVASRGILLGAGLEGRRQAHSVGVLGVEEVLVDAEGVVRVAVTQHGRVHVVVGGVAVAASVELKLLKVSLYLLLLALPEQLKLLHDVILVGDHLLSDSSVRLKVDVLINELLVILSHVLEAIRSLWHHFPLFHLLSRGQQVILPIMETHWNSIWPLLLFNGQLLFLGELMVGRSLENLLFGRWDDASGFDCFKFLGSNRFLLVLRPRSHSLLSNLRHLNILYFIFINFLELVSLGGQVDIVIFLEWELRVQIVDGGFRRLIPYRGPPCRTINHWVLRSQLETQLLWLLQRLHLLFQLLLISFLWIFLGNGGHIDSVDLGRTDLGFLDRLHNRLLLGCLHTSDAGDLLF